MSYRILSLDGGGSWAIIQVMVLMKLYPGDPTGNEVLSDFDLVAANSGGSIVLATLIENYKLSEIFAFFNSLEKRQSVFSKTDSVENDIVRAVAHVGPLYSTDQKLAGLRAALPNSGGIALPQAVAPIKGNATGAPVHVLITSFDYDRNRAVFFRSSDTSSEQWGVGDETGVALAEAVHASSTAPVNYFDKPATFSSSTSRYWDGGIAGCNNPVLAAVTEAIGRQQEPKNIVALSIGTGSVVLPCQDPGEPASPYLTPRNNPGIITDLKKLATSIVDDPPDIATFLAHVMTGSGADLNGPLAVSRIVRLNPLISPIKEGGHWIGPGGMQSIDFTKLATLTLDAVAQDDVDAITSYAGKWISDVAPNQPIRMDSATLACELGQDKFSAALAAWQAIR